MLFYEIIQLDLCKSGLSFKLCYRPSHQSGVTHLIGSNLKNCKGTKIQGEVDVNGKQSLPQKCRCLITVNST